LEQKLYEIGVVLFYELGVVLKEEKKRISSGGPSASKNPYFVPLIRGNTVPEENLITLPTPKPHRFSFHSRLR